jgi:hypothetical protein
MEVHVTSTSYVQIQDVQFGCTPSAISWVPPRREGFFVVWWNTPPIPATLVLSLVAGGFYRRDC